MGQFQLTVVIAIATIRKEAGVVGTYNDKLSKGHYSAVRSVLGSGSSSGRIHIEENKNG